ncbi:MAG: class I SAM-dependent methyltransferase [Candidatus Bipolaricaulia bacterium]
MESMTSKWDEYTAKREGAASIDTKLLKEVASGRILDVGCGIGKHLSMVNSVMKIGVDPGFPGLLKGRALFKDVHFICATGYNLPFKESIFDTVLSIDVIEHVDRPDVFLGEIHRVLKVGGYLFLQTPNYPIKRLYDLLHWLKRSRTVLRDDPTHVSRFKARRVYSSVKDHGFIIRRFLARNIAFQKYFPLLMRLRETPLGNIIGQKVIIIAEKQ